MKKHSINLLALIALLGFLAMGPGNCAKIKTEKSAPVKAPEQAAQPRTPNAPEAENPKAKKFALVYQAMMNGETEPCG